MSSANKYSFYVFLLICMPFFISSPYCISKTSNSMWKKSAKRGHLCLVSDLSGKASSSSPLSIMLGVSILKIVFTTLRMFTLYQLRVFEYLLCTSH